MGTYFLDNHVQIVRYGFLIFAISILLFLFIGWAYGRHRLLKEKEVTVEDALEKAIYSLTALILGFTFITSINHFNDRTESIRSEALSLNRMYDATKYLNADDQITAKKYLNDIVTARLDVYKDVHTVDDLDRHIDYEEQQLEKFHEFIIQSITRAPANNLEPAKLILGGRLQQLMDAFFQHQLRAKNHPSFLLERFLYAQLVVSSMLCGYSMAVKKHEDWLLTTLYLSLLLFLMYIIFCLEFPNLLMDFDIFNRELLRFQKLVQ
ncbi:hypothetical protein [Polynucleobacter arcticus]|uniref:DUF4239 domain-containing protein n=1 Tax=Polynucleobacter arcticus TaxID=1743165 RepID=A0A6M9PVS8_9BURK|nr:hypothetical protein [Polynucleobacter arcticus]QKM60073.1 hypothetical protein DN92_02920 [Polynucleobacter arcticus]